MSTLSASPPWSLAKVGFLGLQVLVTLVVCGFAFAIAAGPPAGLHITATVLLTSVFMLAQLSFGAGYRSDHVGFDGRGLAAFVLAAVVGTVAAAGLRLLVPSSIGLELSPIIVAGAAVVLFGVMLRLGGEKFRERKSARRPNRQRTIVIGSGDAAASLVRLIQQNDNFQYSVVGCVDDQILSPRVGGSPVLGTIDDLPHLIREHRVECVIVAIPAASAQLIKRITNGCVKSSGPNGNSPAIKILPGVLELLQDRVKSSRIRPVQPEDLLPREPVIVDLAEIAPHVENQVILVTGAGGSIGSELCRQIVRLNPSNLLLLGHGENSLFDIDEELKLNFGFNRTKLIIADVADATRIRSVFSLYRPHVVFHSAAHKHVPMLEDNVCEAARNNVLGTHVVALAAAAAGVAKFVLLSTDKAVNPTSVMGATKRGAELVSQSFLDQTGTEFVTVRFGNVLDSRGSVIPIFKKQIEKGGPITLTHRDMRRYFMTIPEAVSLVMQAMALGRDGQVLVLDMGQPVSIVQLAETLITLSGLTPGRDIKIIETGIRPGEKLHEEILTSYEGLTKTSHARIFIARQERVAYETLAQGLRVLETGIRTGDQTVVLGVLQDLVPSFQPRRLLVEGSTNGKVIATDAVLAHVPSPGDRAAQEGNGHSDVLVVADVSHSRAKEGSQRAGVFLT